MCVCVCVCARTRAPALIAITESHRLGGFIFRNCFLTVLGAGRPVQVPAFVYSGQCSFWLADSCLLSVPSCGGEKDLPPPLTKPQSYQIGVHPPVLI